MAIEEKLQKRYVNTAYIIELFGKSKITIAAWRNKDKDPLPHIDIGTGGKSVFRYNLTAVVAWAQRNKRETREVKKETVNLNSFSDLRGKVIELEKRIKRLETS